MKNAIFCYIKIQFVLHRRHSASPLLRAAGYVTHTDSSPMRTGITSFGFKQQGREADHSLVTSAEIKRTWNRTSILPYNFVAWRGA
jgi:hypothetical protein